MSDDQETTSSDHLPEEGMPVSSTLDQHLDGVLASKGYAFEAAGKKYGVDPALLASITILESDHGRSPVAKKYNNVSGTMTGPEQKDFRKYDSVDDSIDEAARNLSTNYLQKDLTTIPQIGAVYSPVRLGGQPVANDLKGTNKTWPGEVQQIYTQMGGTKKFFGPQSVGVGANMMEGSPDAPPPSPNLSTPGLKPPPPSPPPVADADDDSSSSSGQLGSHWGAVNV